MLNIKGFVIWPTEFRYKFVKGIFFRISCIKWLIQLRQCFVKFLTWIQLTTLQTFFRVILVSFFSIYQEKNEVKQNPVKQLKRFIWCMSRLIEKKCYLGHFDHFCTLFVLQILILFTKYYEKMFLRRFNCLYREGFELVTVAVQLGVTPVKGRTPLPIASRTRLFPLFFYTSRYFLLFSTTLEEKTKGNLESSKTKLENS